MIQDCLVIFKRGEYTEETHYGSILRRIQHITSHQIISWHVARATETQNSSYYVYVSELGQNSIGQNWMFEKDFRPVEFSYEYQRTGKARPF